MAVKASAQITIMYVVDVKAYYRYYLLQSSTLSTPSKPTTYPPSSTWDDTEPAYVDGSTNTLYFVDCTVFNDNTYKYSEVSKSSSYEAAKTAYNKAVNAESTASDAQESADKAQNDIDNIKIYTYTVLSLDGGSTLTYFDFSGHMESGTISNGADSDNTAYVRSYEYVKVTGGSTYIWSIKDIDGTEKIPTTHFYKHELAEDGSDVYTYLSSQSNATITVPEEADICLRFNVAIISENVTNAALELTLSDLDSIIESQTVDVYVGIYTTLTSYMSVDANEYEWELTDSSSFKNLEDLINQLSDKLYNETDGNITILNLGIEAAQNAADDAQDAADNAQNSVDQLDDKLYNEETGDIYKIGGDINDINERLGYILIKPEEPSITLLTTPPDPDDPEKEAIGSRVVVNNEKVSFQQKRSEEDGLTEGAYIGYVENDRTAMAATSVYITETYPRVENPDPTSEEKWIGGLCWIARTNGHLSLKVVK